MVRGLVVVDLDVTGCRQPGDADFVELGYLENSLEGDVVAPYFLEQELPLEVVDELHTKNRPKRWC